MAWNNIPDWAYSVTKSILESVKAKDPHTFFHCCRVGHSARLLAKSIGLNEYEQIILEYSGLLHDIGKVGIPDKILFKPSTLTPEETHMMRMHPIKGLQIIKPLTHEKFFDHVSEGIELHHERLDGLGYPYGLQAKEISTLVRILTLVDAVDAMTSTRPYRKGTSIENAIKELERHKGTQFDPNFVKIYIESHKSFDQANKEKSSERHITEDLLKSA